MSYALQAAHEVLQPYLTAGEAGDILVAAKCYGLLIGYDHRWKDAPYRIDDVECVLTSDLFNPETGRKSRSFIEAGKIDVRATEIATGAKVVFDHKTASQDITDPLAPYWKQLAIEGQVSHYMLLEWLNGNKVDCGIWDVIRKPGISPKALSKKDTTVILDSSMYYDFELDDAEAQLFRESERETPLMYAARLAYDCCFERSEWYFQRRKVPRLDAEIREYGIELWGHAQDILLARNSGRHPRNSGACFTYNSPCKFLGVCSGYDTIDSEKWIQKDWVHNELPVLNSYPETLAPARGTDVLTNSRVRCFQTCRQKHYFQYELGVEKLDEEEKESIFFGTMMHDALEQYFLALQKQQQQQQQQQTVLT